MRNAVKIKPKVNSVKKFYSACLCGKIGQHGYWVIAFFDALIIYGVSKC